MDMKDVCGACGDILEEVMDAIERNDYSDLNNKINHTVNNAVDQIKSSVKTSTKSYEKRTYTYKSTKYNYDTKEQYNYDTKGHEIENVKRNEIIANNTFGMVTGIFQMVFGIILSGSFGMFALCMLILVFFGNTFLAVPCFILAVFSGISVRSVVKGNKKIQLLKRFQKYKKLIGTRDYIEIREIKDITGYKKDVIIKDIKELINNNMFPQGRLDKRKTTLMLTDEIYQQYIEVEKWETEQKLREKFQKAEEAKAHKEEPVKQETPKQVYEESVQKILDSGEEYIRIVHKCNDDIPDEEMSDKLYKLENIMSRIFEQVKRDPDSADDLHKLMDYYLPTTIKHVKCIY